LCRSTQVVIVGGGNSAGQAAVYLSEHASKVLLLIRGDDLGKNMSHYLVRRIEQTPNIEVRRFTAISQMHGDESLAMVELICSQNGLYHRIHVSFQQPTALSSDPSLALLDRPIFA
jgi:thioredoxin reductase (NADPH)